MRTYLSIVVFLASLSACLSSYIDLGCFSHNKGSTATYAADQSGASNCETRCKGAGNEYFYLWKDSNGALRCACSGQPDISKALNGAGCDTPCPGYKCGGTASDAVSFYQISTASTPAPVSLNQYVGCFEVFGAGLVYADTEGNGQFPGAQASANIQRCEDLCSPDSKYFSITALFDYDYIQCRCIISVNTTYKTGAQNCTERCAGYPCGDVSYVAHEPTTSFPSTQNSLEAFSSVYNNAQYVGPKPVLTPTQIFTDKMVNGWIAKKSTVFPIKTSTHSQNGAKSIKFALTNNYILAFYNPSRVLDATSSNTYVSMYLSNGPTSNLKLSVSLFNVNADGSLDVTYGLTTDGHSPTEPGAQPTFQFQSFTEVRILLSQYPDRKYDGILIKSLQNQSPALFVDNVVYYG